MREYLLVIAIVISIAAPEHGRAATWDRNEFLGPKKDAKEVTQLVSRVEKDRYYVAALGKLATPEAMTALLKVAYREPPVQVSPTTARDAAFEYIRAFTDKSDAKPLLLADDLEVVAMGLVALIGKPIDDALLTELRRLSLSESAHVRSKVAFILRDDPSKGHNESKAQILLGSMESVPGCIDATNMLSFGESVFVGKHTLAEFTLTIQASALGTMTNLPREFWRNHPLPPSGLARDFMVLGQAQAGNAAAREDARTILKGSESLTARLQALRVLMWRPTKEDAEAARWIAEHDTFKATASVGYFNMPNADQTTRDKPVSQRQIYVMRFLAEHHLSQTPH